jgi:ABC-type tungstate transport system permease subunit
MRQWQRATIASVFLLLLPSVVLACGDAEPEENDIVLAIDSRIAESGLLDVVLPAFEEKTAYDVELVQGETEALLDGARDGGVDVLLTGDPSAEEAFAAQGYGVNRQSVMRDSGDPALARQYHVMQVEPAKIDGVNAEGASVLIEFLTSEEGQILIGDFTSPDTGSPAFVPQAGDSTDGSD